MCVLRVTVAFDGLAVILLTILRTLLSYIAIMLASIAYDNRSPYVRIVPT